MGNMRRTSYRARIVLTAALIAATAPAATAVDLSDHVDEVFHSLMREHDIPGLEVAVIVDGEAQFFNYGIASRGQGTDVNQNAIFEIGSISKIFTAILGAHACSVCSASD